MSLSVSSNKLLVKNTLMLYIRMFFMMAVSLYTSRIILDVLGVSDYGIYNVVGGLVSSLSLLTSSLSGAISRFITFELGKSDNSRLKSIVTTSFQIQILISLGVILIAETLGIWFLNDKMNINHGRMYAANWVFQASIVIFVIRLLIVPLNALIISHEKMEAFAYFSIIEVLLQLGIVFLLKYVAYDSLIIYSILMATTVLMVFFMYLYYCKRHFPECVYTFKFNREITKEMAGYAGWKFFGSTAAVLRNQGVDVIVNMFFGVMLNAARGVANQLSSAASRLVDSFTTALRPQVIKSYAEGDFNRTKFLLSQGTRFSIYLVLCYTIPMILEMETILSLWLKVVPDWTTLFCQLQLFTALVASFSQILTMVATADKNIRNYEIIVGIISICAFPIAYIMFVLGLPVYTTYFALMSTEIICFVVRLSFTRKLINMSIRSFTYNIICNILIVGIVSLIIPSIVVNVMNPSFVRLCITTLSSIISIACSVYFIGLSRSEKLMVRQKIKILFQHKFRGLQ